MRGNSRMLLVGVLVFVFPLLFIWVTQSFFTTAYNNIHTIEGERLGTVMDAVTVVLSTTNASSTPVQAVLLGLANFNLELEALNVYVKDGDDYVVYASKEESLVGMQEVNQRVLTGLHFLAANDHFRNETYIDGVRYWQGFRRVDLADSQYYVFSFFDMSAIDAEMSYRRQQSYFGLTVIFAFLIALAYWLNRQTHWQAHYVSLQEQLHERDLFSNMIAHEFRAPLTAIKGYASFLQESKSLGNEDVRFVGNIRHSAEHLVALVNDFLEVARLQSGKLKVEKLPTDIRIVITDTIESLRSMATEKRLELRFEPNPKPVMIDTDPARLQQVLTNVITNAIKYTEQGSVTLKCIEFPDTVNIRVMDTGMGISAEDQQKLFAPFTRVGGVDKTKVTGTGLGMFITKQLITLLGGTVGVESIKGVGSHIVISITRD